MPLNFHLYIGYCPSYHSLIQYKFPAACCPLIAYKCEYKTDIVLSVRLRCHQRGSVKLILYNAPRKVGFVILCFTLLRKHVQFSKLFVVTKKEKMYKFKIYVLVSSVAIFYLFSLSILHWDCKVMWLFIFLQLIHKSFRRLYSKLYNDASIMQTNDRCYVSNGAARIINSDYVTCVFMWYSFCFQGCISLAVSLTKVPNTHVSTIYIYALQ